MLEDRKIEIPTFFRAGGFGSDDVEPGVYPGRLVRVVQGPETQYGPTSRWIFEVDTKAGTKTVSTIVSLRWRAEGRVSKSALWASRILGRSIRPEEDPREVIAACFDRPCLVVVERRRTSAGLEFSDVREVLPYISVEGR